MKLKEQIQNYQPKNEQEVKAKSEILAYMETQKDCFTREAKAHFTASAWILNPNKDCVLMVYHNIYDSWSISGGHADGEEDLAFVAQKEAKEECGVDVKFLQHEIFSLEVLPVRTHFKNNALIEKHIHMNVTYLCEADDTLPLKVCPNENSAVAWISMEQVIERVSEKHMRPIYQKMIQFCR